MSTIVAVELAQEIDRDLYTRYYKEQLIPNFGMFEDELDPLDALLELVETQQHYYHTPILLFDSADKERCNILGGATAEYYRESNVGLIGYLTVGSEHQGKGLGHRLIQEVLLALERQARLHHKVSCAAVVLETNSVLKVEASRDVLPPVVRHHILDRLGFRFLHFPYVLPALSVSQSKCYDMVLCCYHTFLKQTPDHREPCIESEVILGFMREFFDGVMGAGTSEIDEDYQNMVAFARAHKWCVTLPQGTA